MIREVRVGVYSVISVIKKVKQTHYRSTSGAISSTNLARIRFAIWDAVSKSYKVFRHVTVPLVVNGLFNKIPNWT